jgi:hypothetical protein
MSFKPRTPGLPSAGADLSAMEQNIELTRRDLDETLEALQDRLSPRRRLRAAVQAARETGSTLAQNVTSTARRYRTPALIVSACVLLAIAARAIAQRRR